MPTAAAAATPISGACPECGIIRKSGTISCCGDGGSWFGQCGGAGKAELHRTWHEGVRACKAQSLTAVGQGPYAPQPRSNALSGQGGMGIAEAIFVAVHMFASAPGHASTLMPRVKPISAPDGMPVAAQDREPATRHPATTLSKPIGAATAIAQTPATAMPPRPPSPPPDYPAILEPTRAARSGVAPATSSPSSASVSTTVREGERLSQTVARIYIMAMIVCLH